jgi:hypothetical protein
MYAILVSTYGFVVFRWCIVFLAAAVMLCAGCLLATWCVSEGDGRNDDARQFDLIQIGMDRSVVESILGGPPNVVFDGSEAITPVSPPAYTKALMWSKKSMDIWVYCDGNSRVMAVDAVKSPSLSVFKRVTLLFCKRRATSQ